MRGILFYLSVCVARHFCTEPSGAAGVDRLHSMNERTTIDAGRAILQGVIRPQSCWCGGIQAEGDGPANTLILLTQGYLRPHASACLFTCIQVPVSLRRECCFGTAGMHPAVVVCSVDQHVAPSGLHQLLFCPSWISRSIAIAARHAARSIERISSAHALRRAQE